jgi:hypothetical protein
LAGKSWVHNHRAKRTALPKAVAEVEDRSEILAFGALRTESKAVAFSPTRSTKVSAFLALIFDTPPTPQNNPR